MSSTGAVLSPTERLDALFGELAELAGQRNAIDGRIVEIVAEVDRDGLWVPPGHGRWPGWWPGSWAPRRAMPRRSPPSRSAARPSRCVGQLQQAGCRWIRSGSSPPAPARDPTSTTPSWPSVATVNQLRTAIKLEPRPDPDPRPEPQASITKNTDEHPTWWRIKLPHAQSATLDAAINAHREAPITDWKQARGDASSRTADARGPRGLPAAGRGRLGHRSHPPPARCAHHRRGPPRPRQACRRPAPGAAAL